MAREPFSTSLHYDAIQPTVQRVAKALIQPLRLLHVDDTEGVLVLQRLHLQRRSETVVEYVGVLDSPTAFQTIATWRPDLIISDITRPCMDGFTFTQILKSRPETQHIPVAFLTANGGQQDRDRAYAAGAAAYFVKPFSHLAQIRQLATAYRVEDTLLTVPPYQQDTVCRRLLSIEDFDAVMRAEIERRLSAGV
jgi:CheY-like chemotaxis protein